MSAATREKLFEELFDTAEPPARTDTDKVLVALPRSMDAAAVF